MRDRTISERVIGKAANARSSNDAKSWMFVTDSCADLREMYSFLFDTSGRAASVISGAMRASKNVKDECDMISSQTSYPVWYEVSSGEFMRSSQW